MNRNQLVVLAMFFSLLGILFIYLPLNYGRLPCNNMEGRIYEQYNNGEITLKLMEELQSRRNVLCAIINGEIDKPFVCLFYSLWGIFIICALLGCEDEE